MKSKLIMLLMIVPCLGILVATAVAQSFATSASQDPAPVAAPTVAPPPSARTLYSTVGTGQPGQSTANGVFYRHPFFRQDDVSSGPSIDPLIDQLKEAKSDADKDKIKGQLKEVLETQFAARQQRHEKEIADLEAKVKKLKELVGKRQENRREIVANRLDQILRDAQGLGW